MIRLEKKLRLWTENNLISPEQKDKILDFENKDSKSYLLLSLLYLGIFTIGIGIISLIAANWDAISPGIKLGVDFAILIALVWIIVRRNSPIWQETGIFSLFLMTGASIGLVAQIFQTNGTTENGCLLWALFTLPLLVVSRKWILPLFWVPVLATGIFGQRWFGQFLSRLDSWLQHDETCFFSLIMLIFAAGAYGFYKLNLGLNKKYPVFGVLRMYCEGFACVLAFIQLYVTPLALINIEIPVVYFAVVCCFYYHINNPKMTGLNIIFIGICFTITFIQMFYNLLRTGLGLIVTGIVILLLVAMIKETIQNVNASRERK